MSDTVFPKKPTLDKSLLKDSRGRLRASSLFVETLDPRTTIAPVFTLREYDLSEPHIISLKDHFINASDPTGYSTATKLLAGWLHWNKLLEVKAIKMHIDLWQEELAAKLRSEVLKSMYITAVSEGSKGVAAAKYIAEQGWDKADGLKRGRLARGGSDDIQGEERGRRLKEIEDDAQRIRGMTSV